MTEFIYKVASRNEGKTKWLLDQAKAELDSGECVVFFTDKVWKGLEYNIFLHKYASKFNEDCNVISAIDICEIPHNSVVLIDNLLQLNMHMNKINSLYGLAKRVYITIDGKLAPPEQHDDKNPNQISIFDLIPEEELYNNGNS